ncbi:hypothetical protein JXB02_05700 [Candidatus Woesearchaeota archaeon]|nr:hypothetical protein [Candidatus Woesearchaeota archaeon]
MTLGRLFTPHADGSPMRVLALGSGSGTNIEALIHEEHRQRHLLGTPTFEIAAILTNKTSSRIVEEFEGLYGIPVIEHPNLAYARSKGREWKEVRDDDGFRQEYDNAGLAKVADFQDRTGIAFDLVVLGGYMLRLSRPWIESFPNLILNVHPADLRILDGQGKRRFRGDDAVYDAYISEEKGTASTIHIVNELMDEGPIVLISEQLPFKVPYEELDGMLKGRDLRVRIAAAKTIASYHQELQKMKCDWPAYIQAVNRFAAGDVYCDAAKGSVSIAETRNFPSTR